MTPVPSPCRKICTLDVHGMNCTACGRTLVEITDWLVMDDEARRRVWARLGQAPGQTPGNATSA